MDTDCKWEQLMVVTCESAAKIKQIALPIMQRELEIASWHIWIYVSNSLKTRLYFVHSKI